MSTAPEHPQILGTGTEDYVNDAWGLRVSFGPWTGTPVAEGELVGARLTGYRWHVPDPIPFTKSLVGRHRARWLDLQCRRLTPFRFRGASRTIFRAWLFGTRRT